MKDVNQELENSSPVWDANLGRWIEPEEHDCERNAKQWPSIEVQLEYWKTHDHGGNVIPSRIESNEEQYP